ncbi:hypothetical protein EDB83DRAFT_2314201 [Lactarius deliciosus]|nr:hypothetical protein EDB83DRAFT_2314201 [Lactarius deliciosus]
MFRMFRTLSAFGRCFAHFAHFDFSPVPQGAPPLRGLSGSSTMRRRPWRPPLQNFVSRGSGSMRPTVPIPDPAASETETRPRPPRTYLRHLAPREGLRAHSRRFTLPNPVHLSQLRTFWSHVDPLSKTFARHTRVLHPADGVTTNIFDAPLRDIFQQPARFPLKRSTGTLEELDRHLRTLMYSVCFREPKNDASHHRLDNEILSDNNQAAVISNPQNHVFVLKNSGFVTYGVTGSYDVLAIVDQRHFRHAIKDRVTSAILGRSFEAFANSSTRDYVVGSLCTRDQVPMSLTLYLKLELEEPFQARRARVRDALRCAPGQDLVHIDPDCHTFSMVKQHPIGGDSVENSESSSEFLSALRTHATDDLHTAALEYDTIPQGLSAIHRRDRQHDGTSITRTATRRSRKKASSPSPASKRKPAPRRRILDRRGAHATEFAVEAVAIRIKARADAEVADEFAQETSRHRQEIERIAAFGHKAVFVPTEVMDVVLAGMVAGVGVDLRT